MQRIDPDRPLDVLELSLAEIRYRHVEPTAHLAVGVLGQADRAWRGDPLQPRGDIDAITHQIAVALFDDVAQMNADAKLYALVGRDARVALDHGVLHFERAAHGVDDAAELDDAAVAGALDDAAMMHGNRGINQIAAQRAHSRQSSIFVSASEPAIADHIRNQNRRNFPGFAHGAPLAIATLAQTPALICLSLSRFRGEPDRTRHPFVFPGRPHRRFKSRQSRKQSPARAGDWVLTQTKAPLISSAGTIAAIRECNGA